jgi:hypothetical protein
MRQFLVLAILLVGIRSAAPETKYQDSIRAVAASPFAAFAIEMPLGETDRVLAVALPVIESVESAHDLDEEVRTPPSPAPVVAGIDANADVADSLEGLCKALMTSAQDSGLPVPFFANLIWQESRLKHDAVSPVGAQGIAQFMPEVAAAEGVSDPFDPRQAIPASARLLRTLRQHFGNLGFAAAAYNAGPRRVGEWLDRRHALPRETRNYVERVTGRTMEAWRKSPVDDAKLTFERLLPCRALPAFVELEHAQLHEIGQPELAQQRLLRPRPTTVAVKAAQTAAPKIEPSIAHPLIAERKRPSNVAHAAAAAKMARNFRSGKHEAVRPQRTPREKHRIA